MKIKQFNPPSFKTWYSHNCNYEKTLGAYTCIIKEWAHGRSKTYYVMVVSDNSLSTNFYTKQTIRQMYICDWTKPDAERQLQQWYEDTVKYLHEQWTLHITQAYLVDIE